MYVFVSFAMLALTCLVHSACSERVIALTRQLRSFRSLCWYGSKILRDSMYVVGYVCFGKMDGEISENEIDRDDDDDDDMGCWKTHSQAVLKLHNMLQ